MTGRCFISMICDCKTTAIIIRISTQLGWCIGVSIEDRTADECHNSNEFITNAMERTTDNVRFYVTHKRYSTPLS